MPQEQEPGSPVAWCEHPRARHVHGTLAAYAKCGCRCWSCGQARYRYGKRNELSRLRGSPEWVSDLAPLREHIHSLLAWITPVQIEQRAGVNRTMVRYIVGWAPGRPAAKRVRREVYDKLMAVRPDAVDDRDDCLVDPTGTLRRFRALVALGWPQKWLAPHLGISAENIATTFNGSPVRARLRNRMARVYDELSAAPPVGTTPAERRSITRARAIAADRGWLPPAAWDDDLIDDPNVGHNADGTLARGLSLAA